MNRRGRQAGLLALGLSLLLARAATGQADTNSPPLNPPVRTVLAHGPRRSPVAFFRDLLDLTAAQRDPFLSNRSPETKRRIEEKVEEYEALSPDERELRLRTTELYWYLRPLMTMAREERTQRLAQVPDDLRQIIADRLDLWDITPPYLKD